MLLFKLTSAKKLVEDGLRNVCLLRAKITLTKQFYVEGLRKFIIEAIIPNRNGIEEVKLKVLSVRNFGKDFYLLLRSLLIEELKQLL